MAANLKGIEKIIFKIAGILLLIGSFAGAYFIYLDILNSCIKLNFECLSTNVLGVLPIVTLGMSCYYLIIAIKEIKVNKIIFFSALVEILAGACLILFLPAGMVGFVASVTLLSFAFFLLEILEPLVTIGAIILIIGLLLELVKKVKK